MIKKGDLHSIEAARKTNETQAREILAQGGYDAQQTDLILRAFQEQDNTINEAVKLIGEGDRREAAKLLLQHGYNGKDIETISEMAVALAQPHSFESEFRNVWARAEEYAAEMLRNQRIERERKAQERIDKTGFDWTYIDDWKRAEIFLADMGYVVEQQPYDSKKGRYLFYIGKPPSFGGFYTDKEFIEFANSKLNERKQRTKEENVTPFDKVENEFRELVSRKPEIATIETFWHYKGMIKQIARELRDKMGAESFEQKYGQEYAGTLARLKNIFDKFVVRREKNDKFMKNKSNLEIEKVFEAEPYLTEGIKPSDVTLKNNLFRMENILKREFEPEFKVCDTTIKGNTVSVKLFDAKKNEFSTFEDNLSTVLTTIKKNIIKEEIPNPQEQLEKPGPKIVPVLAARGYRLVSKEEDLKVGESGLFDPNQKEEQPTDTAATVEQHVSEKLPLYIIERVNENLYRVLDREGNTILYNDRFRKARRDLLEMAQRGELQTVQADMVKNQTGGEIVTTQTIRRQAATDVLKAYFNEDSAKAIVAAMIVKSTLYDVADTKQEVERRGEHKYHPDVTASGVDEYKPGDQVLENVAESKQEQEKRGQSRYAPDITADPRSYTVYQTGEKVSDRTVVQKNRNFR